MQYNIVFPVNAAVRLPPSRRRQIPVGRLLCVEHQDDRKGGGHDHTGQDRGGLVAGGGRVYRDTLRLKPTRKRTVPCCGGDHLCPSRSHTSIMLRRMSSARPSPAR